MLHLTAKPRIHGVDAYGQFSGVTSSEKVETVRLLINHGMDVTAKDESLSTPLHLASSSGVPDIVRLLIESGADVTAKNRSSRTPLHLASSWVSIHRRHCCYVCIMLDINEQDDYYHRLPPELNKKLDIMRLLIDHGADPALLDETNSTPLHLAAYYGTPDTVQLLIEHGADATSKDGSGKTPLHLALSKVISSFVTLNLAQP